MKLKKRLKCGHCGTHPGTTKILRDVAHEAALVVNTQPRDLKKLKMLVDALGLWYEAFAEEL